MNDLQVTLVEPQETVVAVLAGLRKQLVISKDSLVTAEAKCATTMSNLEAVRDSAEAGAKAQSKLLRDEVEDLDAQAARDASRSEAPKLKRRHLPSMACQLMKIRKSLPAIQTTMASPKRTHR